jgi:hypothetical protein
MGNLGQDCCKLMGQYGYAQIAAPDIASATRGSFTDHVCGQPSLFTTTKSTAILHGEQQTANDRRRRTSHVYSRLHLYGI